MMDMHDKPLKFFLEKNLLILTPSYPNKDESFIGQMFVKNQVAELKNYFKKVIIIAPVFQSFGYLRKDKLCKDYSYDNVEVFFPRCFYIPILWLNKILIDNRLKVVERTLKKHHILFDLIHAHFTWPSGYIGVKLKERKGTPVVITIHENEGMLNQEIEMNNYFINTTWSCADVLIRVNKKDVPVLQRYNGTVYSIPNGFSPLSKKINISIARKRLGLPMDKKIIFSLGYLIKRKGFNYLIDSMMRICCQRDDVLCFIGGTGSERQTLDGQIDALHLGEKVKLLGFVPGDQLILWLNACDLFVLPSLSEGNPTVMFETLGCGKPFIGTKVGGVPEIIISDTYGLLVNLADSEDLMEKILLALDREWNREAILQYAERFTWSEISKDIIKTYQSVF